MRFAVAVIGGGLAGMAAAVRLTALGHHVTLVERRPYLGGRAYSFTDRETGQQVDNGQHVFLGCCSAYVKFLREAGTEALTSRQRTLRIEVRAGSGRRGVLAAAPLPAPLHLAPAFLAYPHVSFRDKLRAVPALLRIARERDRDRPALRTQSFGAWLRASGQSPRAVTNLWDLIVRPSLNDVSDDVSASMGFMVFQEALLRDRHGADVGYARESLSGVMGTPVARLLRERGADVLLGVTATALEQQDAPLGAVRGVTLAGGRTLEADAYVLAVTPERMLDLLPPALRAHPSFAPAATHTWSPIVDLHLWYDRPVADFDFCAFVESPVQWVFNRSRIAGLPGPGEYLTVSLSAAWEHWPMGKEALREHFEPELKRLLPRARAARIERFVVVKDQRATFRSLPNGPANRLPQATPLPNLFLAGDWTDTGWPATMEGAVRSGYAAAALAHGAIGRNA